MKCLKVHEAHKTPSKLDQKGTPLCHIIIKTFRIIIQNKEKIVKVAREKQNVTYTERTIRIHPSLIKTL